MLGDGPQGGAAAGAADLGTASEGMDWQPAGGELQDQGSLLLMQHQPLQQQQPKALLLAGASAFRATVLRAMLRTNGELPSAVSSAHEQVRGLKHCTYLWEAWYMVSAALMAKLSKGGGGGGA